MSVVQDAKDMRGTLRILEVPSQRLVWQSGTVKNYYVSVLFCLRSGGTDLENGATRAVRPYCPSGL